MRGRVKLGLALTASTVGLLLFFAAIIPQYTYSYVLTETVQSNAHIGQPDNNVRYQIVRDGIEREWFETHNVITNRGMNWSQYEQFTQSGAAGWLGWIALSTNTTAPANTWDDCADEIGGDNLTRRAAVVTLDGSVTGGDFIVYLHHNFTATGSQTVAMACIMTDAVDGAPDVPFAIALLSPVATMGAGDHLNLQWNVTATS